MSQQDRPFQVSPFPPNSNSDGHRSEIVGQPTGGDIVMMRCDTRSERSEIGLKNDSAADDVAAEVDAMEQVVRALAMLPNTQSRARVLRWAMDRYQIVVAAPIAAPPPVPTSEASPSSDPTLEVESLDDLFPARLRATEDDLSLAEPARPAQGSGIESMIRGFAEDFRRFALEWQGT